MISSSRLHDVIRKMSRLKVLAASVVVALLSAQAISLVHELDPLGHDPGQLCEICLVSSVLGGANVASPDTAAVVPSPLAGVFLTEAPRAFAAPRPFQARAPPQSS